MPTKLFALLGLVAACSACDETAGAVHRDYLDRHEESFVFHVDRAQIVAGLEGLFADEGVTLVEPTSGDTLATTKSASKWTYVVHLIPCSGGHLVHVVGQLRDDSDAIVATEQETDKMWELAQRLEPDRALEITDAANQRADKVAPRARTAH